MLLTELLARTSVLETRGELSVRVQGVTHDSRRVKPGSLFVAVRGERADGSAFIAQAVKNGAAAVAGEDPAEVPGGVAALRVADARRFLAEASRELFQDPASRLELVAITGTNGKTTTSYLIDSIYRKAGLRSCLVGTLGMRIAGTSYPTAHTTPEAPELTDFLDRAAADGCTHGVLEVSSHALQLKRVFGMRFGVGVFTNLTRDHLDFHHDMESYFRAKRLLFLPENGNQVRTAVVNIDDGYGRRLVAEAECPALTCSLEGPADIQVVNAEVRADGTTLRIRVPSGEMRIESKLVGRPNMYNVMSAAGAARALGLDPGAICEGIEALEGIPGRMERVDAGQAFTVLVDYAHTPDALEKALRTVRELPHGRIITVFGCGGDRDRTKRPIMGAVAARLSDITIATSDNPRTEDPLAILSEIESGLRQENRPYELIPDRREAIRTAVGRAVAGDVVLVAGKGHEDYQIIGSRTLAFDDRVVARESIEELRHP